MLGQAQIVHGADFGVDNAEHNIDPEPLSHHAGPKSTDLIGIGKIGIPALRQVRFLQIGEKIFRERGCFRGGQGRRIWPNRAQYPMQSPKWRGIDAEMDVGSTALLPNGEIIVDVRERV
jgi:hypothetical protein